MYFRGNSGLRGLGALCSSISVAPGFVGPIDCDPSGGPVNYTAANPNQTTLSDPYGWFAIDAGNPSGVVLKTPAQTPGAWLMANAMGVSLALAAAALFIGLAKR